MFLKAAPHKNCTGLILNCLKSWLTYDNYYGIITLKKLYAGVVKLADTLDLGSNAERCAGSSPVTRTISVIQNR